MQLKSICRMCDHNYIGYTTLVYIHIYVHTNCCIWACDFGFAVCVGEGISGLALNTVV